MTAHTIAFPTTPLGYARDVTFILNGDSVYIVEVINDGPSGADGRGAYWSQPVDRLTARNYYKALVKDGARKTASRKTLPRKEGVLPMSAIQGAAA